MSKEPVTIHFESNDIATEFTSLECLTSVSVETSQLIDQLNEIEKIVSEKHVPNYELMCTNILTQGRITIIPSKFSFQIKDDIKYYPICKCEDVNCIYIDLKCVRK